jgi:hypothetical protein
MWRSRAAFHRNPAHREARRPTTANAHALRKALLSTSKALADRVGHRGRETPLRFFLMQFLA